MEVSHPGSGDYADVVLSADSGACLPLHGTLRGIRAVLVAAAAIGIGVAGHVVGSGSTPSVPTAVVLVLGASMLCAALSGRRWTPARLTAALLLTQGGLHLLGSGDAGLSAGPAMVIWHLAATAVSVAVLTRGEDLIWVVVDVLALRPWRWLTESPIPVQTHRRLSLLHHVGRLGASRPTLIAPVRGPPL